VPISFVDLYQQNFNSLALTGTSLAWTNDLSLPGWFLFRQPSSAPVAIPTYSANTGSSDTGAFYSYGSSGSSDRALGGLGSGGNYFGSPGGGEVAGWIALALTNSSGAVLEALNIQFAGEQWRKASNSTAQSMTLSYGFASSFATVTTWTTPGGSFSWSSPQATSAAAAAIEGNTTGRVSDRGGILSGLAWQPNTTLWLRWTEVNDTSTDHGLAIDDLQISAVAPVPTVSLESADASASEATGTKDNARLLIRRSGSTSAALAVTLNLAGTAVRDSDYSLTPLTPAASLSGNLLTIPAGAEAVELLLTPLADSLIEGAETVLISLASSSAYAAGTPSSQTVTISDDDEGSGAIQITEYLYQGDGGEFIEFTNLSGLPVDFSGWSFDDNSRQPGSQDLSGFGVVGPGESVILTEAEASAFRLAWSLSPSVRVIGGLTNNLGRADEINLYDNAAALVDRLTYDDQSFSGTIRTQNVSGWAPASALAALQIQSAWRLSSAGDAQNSRTSGGSLGNPGHYNAGLPGLLLIESAGASTVAEGGSGDSLSLALRSQPLADVVVAVDTGAQLTASSSSFHFTAANWSIPQSLNISAVDDLLVEGQHGGLLRFLISSADPAYQDLIVAERPVAISDNDLAGTPPSLLLTPPQPWIDLPSNGSGGFLSGVINDPTDPARTLGIAIQLADPDTATASLLLSAQSSNGSVVGPSGLLLSGSGADRLLTIAPAGVGLTTITLTVSDGGNSSSSSFTYGASAAAANPAATRFHVGASDASSAIAIDADWMLVSDDEDQVLRLVSRQQSGLAGASFAMDASLGLVGGSEVDLEASTRNGSTLYWLGSHSNNASGDDRPNRERLFATALSGSGAGISLTALGFYAHLEDDLLAWDQAQGGSLGLAASAAAGVQPEQPAGFNIEGLAMAPGGSGAYLAFRAPTLPTSNRQQALIVPVLNIAELINLGGGPAGTARFGTPIQLDLGGRGIRSIERNSAGDYLIVAGPSGAASGAAPADFRLYRWSGAASDAPLLLNADLSSLLGGAGSPEAIVEVPANLTATSNLQLLVDDGDTIWYANGVISKDLETTSGYGKPLQKFRSLQLSPGTPVIPAGSLSLAGGYQQTFDSLISSGSTPWSDGLLPGWSARRTGSGTSLDASTGSSTAGNLYSFGASASSDRALGSIGSGNAAAGSFSWGLRLFNDTGSRLDRVYLSFRGEQWRNSGAAAQSLSLDWRIGGSDLSGDSWSAVPALAFTSPITGGSAGLLDGNLAVNSRLLSGAIEGLNLAAGAELWLRWSDPDHSGSDHGLAIDDVQVSINPLPGISISESAGSTSVNEQAATTDTYTLTLNTTPTAPVSIVVAAADNQTRLSTDGLTFAASLTLILSDQTPQTITVKAVDDAAIEASPHQGVITHTVSSTDSNYNGLSVRTVNVGIQDNDVSPLVTKISQIQGSGSTFNSTYGGTQTIEGIVTRVFLGSTKLNGFYVQEEAADSDGNAATSEAIFVFDSAGLFTGSQGDKVRVTGSVGEYTSSSSNIAGTGSSSLTQLSALTSVVNLGAASLPGLTSVTLPIADGSQLERYEGMLVEISAGSNPLVVTETFKLGRYGQVGLSAGERLGQYTQFNAPSVSGYANYLADLQDGYIILDDGSTSQNPDPVIHARGGQPLSASNPLRGGDTITSITGVLDERFEGYRVQSGTAANFNATNPRSSTAPPVQGTLKIASFNLLNYFNGNGSGAAGSAGGFPTARGANNLGEFERQRAKTIAAVLGLSADIIAYNELENDGYGSSSSAQQLVAGLNAALGVNAYSFITPSAGLLQPDGRFGGDEISVGFLYRSDRVRQAPGSSVAALQSGSFDQGSNRIQRPALAVSFERLDGGVATGEQLTTVVTHLKSKGSSAGGSGDADAGDGQGLSNGSRSRAASELADWLASSPTGLNDPDVLILGDLNSYLKEDPITTLAARGYQSLYGPDSYSYQFNGQWGSLDHMLASASLAAQLGSAHKWAINSDEAVVLDYNTEFKSASQINSFYNADPFRSSDHDPLLAGFLLNPSNRGAASFTISGSPVVGQTLNAALATSDPDGDGAFAYSWQTSANSSDWTVVGTNSSSYSIAPADEGKQLRLVVSYTDARGFAETITVAAGTVPLMPDLAITALTPSQSEGSIGSTAYAFQISRSGDLSGSSRVAWVVEGSGSNPTNTADFALNQWPSGTAAFATGQDNLTITIPVLGDGTVEPDERFRVLLSSASNGRLTPATASATSLILNDDLPAQTYSFTASATTVFEGNAVAIGVITTNVAAGSRLYWQAGGAGITASDFSSGGLNGDVLIGADGRASFTRTIAADAVVDPNETLEIKFFSDTARSLQVGNTINVLIKEPTVGLATDSNDIITGTTAGEHLNGVPSGSSLRGRGSRDELTGQAGDDIFVLGDASGTYYDDGLSANRGSTDMAIIRDFASGDRIQLWGANSIYSLVSALNAGTSGVRIDLKPINSMVPGALPEAIGFVRGATLASLSLSNPTQFLYVNP
jgi:hypothetical protein